MRRPTNQEDVHGHILACRLDDDGFNVKVRSGLEVVASCTEYSFAAGDLTAELADFLATLFEGIHGVDLRATPASWSRLWDAAHSTRQILAVEASCLVQEIDLMLVHGKRVGLDVEIQREKYEALVQPLLKRAEETIGKALSEARTDPSAVAVVRLEEAASIEPLLRSLVENLFPETRVEAAASSEPQQPEADKGAPSVTGGPDEKPGTPVAAAAHLLLIERAQALVPTLHQDDRREVEELLISIGQAEATDEQGVLDRAARKLDDLLFYIVGAPPAPPP